MNSYLLHIYIYPSVQDVYNVSGLCGQYDGKQREKFGKGYEHLGEFSCRKPHQSVKFWEYHSTNYAKSYR